MGSCLSGIGDVDLDGFDDAAILANRATYSTSAEYGRLYVLPGTASAPPSTSAATSSVWTFKGSSAPARCCRVGGPEEDPPGAPCCDVGGAAAQEEGADGAAPWLAGLLLLSAGRGRRIASR